MIWDLSWVGCEVSQMQKSSWRNVVSDDALSRAIYEVKLQQSECKSKYFIFMNNGFDLTMIPCI